MNNPVISVCMATFNGQKFLVTQVASILSQIGLEDELIIADDGSTDDTVDLLRSIGDRRIKLITDRPVRNPALNFERALKAAKGDYIFLSYQDDIWLPGRVELAMQWMKEFDTLVVDCDIINDHEEVVAKSYFSIRKSGRGLLYNLKRNTYLGACMSFRRKMLSNALPFPPGVPMHDIWLGWVSELTGRVKFLPQVCVHYRRHSGNVTVAPDAQSRYGLWDQVRFRWWMVRMIPLVLRRNKETRKLT
jgi:glycosyltransferase involved in cell wall biosynthesis